MYFTHENNEPVAPGGQPTPSDSIASAESTTLMTTEHKIMKPVIPAEDDNAQNHSDDGADVTKSDSATNESNRPDGKSPADSEGDSSFF